MLKIQTFIKSSLGHSILLLVILLLVGTFGYSFIENWSLLDSCYMTVITMSTVGYGELYKLSSQGRIFTIILIFFSLGIVGYVFSVLTSFIIEGELNKMVRRRKMGKVLKNLKDHIILCGGGPTGRSIAEEFIKTKTPFVLIDINPESIQHVRTLGEIASLQGDATEDEILIQAGVKKAKGLVATLSDDKDNVFVVLSAKSLHPKIRIVARLVEEHNKTKLKKAGADEIVSPNAIGGLRMASIMIRPSAVHFLDAMLRNKKQIIRVAEIEVKNFQEGQSKTIASYHLSHTMNLLILAIKRQDDSYVFNPNGKTKITNHDTLIATGSIENINRLKTLFSR